MKKVIWVMSIILIVSTVFTSKIYAESEASPPTLNSEAAILIEANSGEILFEKNAQKEMYPASLTKIATAIYAIDNGNLNENVTVSGNARKVDGTTVFLEKGEKVPLKKLVQGLLINSGNDAGVAIAEHLSGSVEQFSKDLNVYLKDVIGIENTNYVNPHGLFDENHVTTAEDLAKMTNYAINNKAFMDIFSTKKLEWDGKSWDTTIRTHHKLVKDEIPYEGVTGGKNGFVSLSGYTLATTAERDDLSLIVITLKSSQDEQAYEDTINLLDYGFDNYRTSSIEKGSTFKLDEQEFIAPEKISYTHPIGEQPQSRVNEDGMLEVVNQDDTVIASAELNKIKRDNGAAVKTASSQSTFAKLLSILPYLSIPILLVVLGLSVLLIRKRMKRKVAKNKPNYFL